MYIGALATPMFFVATVFASAAAGIDDAVNALTIPSLSDEVDFGIFNFAANALDDVGDILTEFIRGILYFILIIFFDQFASGIKAQFIGSLMSMIFLVNIMEL